MIGLEHLAQVEQRYREDVLYPKLARDARHLRDLELASARDSRLQHGRKPVRWLGWGVLAALRARLGARANGLTSASRS